MDKLDEEILRAFFRYEEYQRQRLWLERLLHPEKFNWAKRGSPPPITRTKQIKIEELSRIGFGEERYQRTLQGEEESEKELCDLIQEHCLWPHLERIKGFGKLTAAKFVAAAGDITRTNTVSSFWKGMGLDVLPDGTVPRRVRGRKDVERRVPALPHVTRIGEQIRQQLIRTDGKLRGLYDKYREYYDSKYPTRPKMFNFKAAERISQKILYACLWKVWRESAGLPAPDPYAFAILKHDNGNIIRIEDLYDR